VGHREVPGRPELLGTTREFLDYFGLKSLDQLPTLAELKDDETIGVQLELSAGEPEASQEEQSEAQAVVEGAAADAESAERSSSDEEILAQGESAAADSAAEDDHSPATDAESESEGDAQESE